MISIRSIIIQPEETPFNLLKSEPPKTFFMHKNIPTSLISLAFKGIGGFYVYVSSLCMKMKIFRTPNKEVYISWFFVINYQQQK